MEDAQDTPPDQRSEVHNGEIGGLPVACVVEALAGDACCAVVVVDERFNVRYANDRAVAAMARVHDPVVGANVRDFFTPPVAEERITLLRQALDSGVPVRAVGMLSGSWNAITYRPFTDERTGERFVLVVCPGINAPGNAATDEEPGVIIHRTRTDDLGPLSQLTERELEVLRLVGLGRTTGEMSREMHRSIKTIDGHLLSIRNKLGERSRVDLARMAIKAGITRLTQDELHTVFRQNVRASHRPSDPDQLAV